MRVCESCLEEKGDGDFYKPFEGGRRRNDNCKICVRAAYHAEKARIIAQRSKPYTPEAINCKFCGETKTEVDFCPSALASLRIGFPGRCNKCFGVWKRKRREAQREAQVAQDGSDLV